MCHERWALHVVIKRNGFYIYSYINQWKISPICRAQHGAHTCRLSHSHSVMLRSTVHTHTAKQRATIHKVLNFCFVGWQQCLCQPTILAKITLVKLYERITRYFNQFSVTMRNNVSSLLSRVNITCLILVIHCCNTCSIATSLICNCSAEYYAATAAVAVAVAVVIVVGIQTDSELITTAWYLCQSLSDVLLSSLISWPSSSVSAVWCHCQHLHRSFYSLYSYCSE